MRWRSPGRPSRRDPIGFPRPASTSRRLRSSCCWTITTISSLRALTISAGCAGICTTCGPSSSCPRAVLTERSGFRGLSRRLARAERSTRVRELERELAVLVSSKAPQLLELPGCGVLTAARVLGEVGDITRFQALFPLANHAGAPRLTPRLSRHASLQGCPADRCPGGFLRAGVRESEFPRSC